MVFLSLINYCINNKHDIICHLLMILIWMDKELIGLFFSCHGSNIFKFLNFLENYKFDHWLSSQFTSSGTHNA